MELLNINSQRLSLLLKEAAILLLISVQYAASANCGGFRYPASPGEIISPNYPAAYPDNSRCIWVFEAPSLYRVFLHIDTFEGQATNTTRYYCNDYIEVRDGSRTSNLLFTSCESLTAFNLTSTARWLWILFSSDGSYAASGLRATYSTVYAGEVIDNVSTPLTTCRTHEFSCSNKQCISNSYRCDGYYDCGCAGEGCDEDECGGLAMSYGARLAMGIGIGVGLFIFICMFSLLWERRHNWAKLNHKNDDKNKNKNKTNQKR